MSEIIDDRGEARLRAAAQRLSNWGRWGDNDQAGTLNHIGPEMVAAAAGLVRRGRVFSLAIPFGDKGPQTGHLGRFNPIRFMLRDGDDTFAREMPGVPRGIGAADDVIMLPTHGATHWDALAHMFFDDQMWNGYDCRLVSSMGAEKNDISSYRDRIVGRGVLLDLPRHLGREYCRPGESISSRLLTECAQHQGVSVGAGDLVLVRTGQLAMCRTAGSWGDFAGGDAPGLDFDSLDWIHSSEIAGVATDTWGVEVRPNEFHYANQPWHRVAIPMIGLLVGEMFDLEELAADCAADGVYEVFFSACPAPVTGSVGGPVNPIAIK
ncbi:MAG: cyclase family protein [Candidatus Dormibacteraceae bacterium]